MSIIYALRTTTEEGNVAPWSLSPINANGEDDCCGAAIAMVPAKLSFSSGATLDHVR